MSASDAAWLAAPTHAVRRTYPYALARQLPWPLWVTAVLLGATYQATWVAVVVLRFGVGSVSEAVRRETVGFPITWMAAFLILCGIEQATEAMLRRVRPALAVSDADYAALAARSVSVTRREDLLVTVAGVLLGPVAWYSGAAGITDVVYRGYVLLGIGVVAVTVALAFGSVIRSIQAIGRVERQPLSIDIFDTDDLAPLAHLSLRLSMAGASIVALMMLFWGFGGAAIAPYLYIGFLVVSGAGFFVPLLSLHERMAAARTRELEAVQTKLREAHERMKAVSVAALREEAETLAHLLAWEARVAAAPTWPYDLAMLGQLAGTLLIPLALMLLQTFLSRL